MNGLSRVAAAASLAACALLSTSCNDGLLHAPAPAQRALVTMRASLAQMSGGASDAYDRTDRVFLRFRVGDDVRYEQELPFSPAGAETSVRLEIPLRQLSETMIAELELRAAGRAIFRGNAAPTLSAGETTPVEFTLEPVVASLNCGAGLVQLNAYGQTAQLSGAALFATGDTVRDVPITWSVAQNFAVSLNEGGEVTALQDGEALATCSAQGLTATRSIRVFAIVSSVQVSPALGVLVVGNTLPLTATMFDARGNAILTPRPVVWSSSAVAVATVSSSGVATGIVAGNAKISATSGTIAGTSDLTVVFTSTAVTTAVTGVTGTSATLIGSVNPRGAATQAWFEWGTDPTLAQPVSTGLKSVGNGTADVAVIETLNVLLPATTYYFRTVSSGVGGESKGEILFFTTPRPPSVTTLSAGITQIIQGRGTVNPNGSATQAWFRYGTNSTLSTFNETAHFSVGNGTAVNIFTDQLTGMLPFTTYYVRTVGSNIGGLALGGIVSFTTGGKPTIGATSGLYSSCLLKTPCAILNSSANPNGMPTEVWFEWSSTRDFSIYQASARQQIGAGSTFSPFTLTVNFAAGGSVFFRAVASNALSTERTAILEPSLPPIR